MNRFRCCLFAGLLGLALPLVLHAQEVASPAETELEQAWGEALTLIEQENFAAALPRVARVAQARPRNAYVARVMGYVLSETGRYEDAVIILRRAVALDPDDFAAQYYLGQALIFKGDVDAGSQELQTVIQRYPDSAFVDASRDLLQQVEATESGTVGIGADAPSIWEFAVQTGWKYDDNVPARSKSDPTPGPRSSSSWYGSVYLDADLWRREDADGMPLVWEAGGSVYGNVYDRSRFRAYDVTSATLQTSLEDRFEVGEWIVQTGLGLSANRVWLDGDRYSSEAGLDLNLDVQLSDRFVLTAGAGGRNVDFESDSAYPEYFSRDGWYHTYSLGGLYYPALESIASLGLTYTFEWADTEGSDYESKAHGADGFVYFRLPAQFGMLISAGYQSEDYVDFIPEPERLDQVWNWSITLSRNLGVEGLTGRLSWSATDADSNQDFTGYEREVFDLSLTWSF